MTDLITELKALKEKATPDRPWEPDGVGEATQADLEFVCALVNHLPTILARLEEGERMREALGRLVSEYDDDGEHGKHAYEQECPLCCAIEDARKFTALEPTHDHT